MLAMVAITLLCLGACLEVSGLGFWGLDFLIGLCFALSALLGAVGYLVDSRRRTSLLVTGLAACVLVFHIWLNLL